MDSKNLIGGLLAGAAIGVAIGMLLAPSDGAKTRKRIVDGSLKLKDDLVDSVDDSVKSLKGRFNYGVDEVSKKGKETIDTASERLKV